VTTADSPGLRAAASAAAQPVREGIAAGSLRHFAVLFSGSPQRATLEALYAFDAELRRIVDATSHEAAHARLQWWRGEIDRLAAGHPDHPLAQALLPLRGRRELDPAQLHEMLVAADLDLARMTYRNWRELDAYLSRAAATLQRMIAATLAGERGVTAAEAEFARRLGAATRQVEMLFDLERDLARGRMYVPTEALETAGIDPSDFARDWRSEPARSLLADWRARVGRELLALPAVLAEPAQRSAQRHGLVLAALHGRWLERWTAADPRGVRKAREFGPLPRLWTAWRTALRYP
jgi:phytoene synthase